MKILIAADGSGASQSIVAAACQYITPEESAAIRIISVVAPLLPMGGEPVALSRGYCAEIERATCEKAETLVGEVALRLKEMRPDLSRISSRVLRGAPAETILEAAREWEAELIVVGSHGYGFWGRVLHGSVSDAVVHQAPCSVLVSRAKNTQPEIKNREIIVWQTF